MAEANAPQGAGLTKQAPMEIRMFELEPRPCCLSHLLRGEGGASFMEIALVSSIVLVLALLILLAMQGQS